MFSNILKLVKTTYGKNIISIILGLGLASLFRNVCKNKNCIEFYGPNVYEIKKNTYKYNNKCHNFILRQSRCNRNKKIINFKLNHDNE